MTLLHVRSYEQHPPTSDPTHRNATMSMKMRPFLCLLLCFIQMVHTIEDDYHQNQADYDNLRAKKSSSLPLVSPAAKHSITGIPIPDGLTFSRTIRHLNASFELQLDPNHCQSHDKYGDNHCHYQWGEQVLGNYSVTFPQAIQHGDYMTGTFHVSNERITILYCFVLMILLEY